MVILMNLIWDDNLSVGIDNIDNQHKELLNCIENLITAIEHSRSNDEIIKTLDFLEEYVIKHFTAEEEIQAKTNYPYSIYNKCNMNILRMILKNLGKFLNPMDYQQYWL